MRVTLTTGITAPPEFVFEYLRDLEKIPLWIKEVEASNYTYQPEDRAEGTRFVQKIRQGISMDEYEGEVTGFEQDRYLQIRLLSESAEMKIEYRLEPISRGCEVRYITEMKGRNLRGTLLGMLFKGFSESVLMRQLLTLKQLVEKEFESSK